MFRWPIAGFLLTLGLHVRYASFNTGSGFCSTIRGDEKSISGYLETLDMYSDDRLLLIPTSPKEVKLIEKAIKSFRRDKKPK